MKSLCHNLLVVLLGCCLAAAFGFAATTDVSYSGRLTSSSGEPLAGPRDIEVRFFRQAESGPAVAVPTQTFANTKLVSGVFSVALTFSPAELQTLFDGTNDVWIEVKDVAASKTYPRQQFGAVPLALKVPVDGKTLSYDVTGKLRLGVTPPVAGAYLTVDGAGNLNWTNDPTTPAQSIQNVTAGSEAGFVGGLTAADAGEIWFSEADDVLKYWDGGQPVVVGTSATGVQDLNGLTASTQTFATGTAGNAPQFVSAGSVHTLNIPMANAGGTVTAGLISNADHVAFSNKLNATGGAMTGAIDMNGNAVTDLPAPSVATDAATKGYVDTALATKQNSLGYTPVNKAGDTMTGALDMSSNKVVNLGTPTVATDAATKLYVDNGLATKQNSLGYSPLDKAGDAMGGNLDMNGNLVVDLPSPTAADHAATKGYVDTNIGSHTHAATAVTQDATHRFITDTERSNWNTAFGWGNHNGNGYLTSVNWASPGAIGATTPSTGAFTTIAASPAAAQVGVTVTGAAGQTANLQEWRNSGGTDLAAITAAGDLALRGGAQTVKVRAHATTADYTLTLPANGGTNGYVLQTDGSGNTSWVSNGPAAGAPKGYIKGAYTDYNDTTSVTISAGAGECDGTTWHKSSSSVYTLTTLTTTEDWHYIYLDCSALPTITLYDATTEPAYDAARNGWYNASGDRVIAAVISATGVAQLKPFAAVEEKIIWDNSHQLVLNGNPTGAYLATTIDADTVTPVNTAQLNIHIHNHDGFGGTAAQTVARFRSVAHIANSIDLDDYGSAQWRSWFAVTTSDRSLEWYGADDDDNTFNLFLNGYEILR